MTLFPQLDAFRGGNNQVRLIGHRGSRGVMPENTMPGFAFTLDIGVDALEFDVVMTRDRVPVIAHNSRLDASFTRDQKGSWIAEPGPRIAELTLRELQTLDVGGLDGRSTYGQRFPDQAFLNDVRIPSLEELLDFANLPERKNLSLMLEFKSDIDAKSPVQERVELVAKVVSQVRARKLEARTVLHSFDWDLLSECRRLAPEMPTSYLSIMPSNFQGSDTKDPALVCPDFGAFQMSLPQAVARAGGQMWCPYVADVTQDLVAEAHQLGLLVSVWTVNDPAEIQRMIDVGVDGIVTDYPGRVQRILSAQGMVWRDDTYGQTA
ncbi:glycerophosphodiester phosphodiesterase [Rhodobacterales bacterium 56_14_T64]|nr:glycerophosphodiester phosphodiesterase [Rhodobacterales bacterium 56_14_T64]